MLTESDPVKSFLSSGEAHTDVLSLSSREKEAIETPTSIDATLKLTQLDDSGVSQHGEDSLKFDSSKTHLVAKITRPIETTPRQFGFICTVFLIIGMTNFYGYSAALNASQAIQKYLYPDVPTLADTLTAVLMSFDFLVTAWFCFFGSLNQSLITVGLFLMFIGSTGVLLTCIFIRGPAGAGFLHLFCGLVGSGSSISCSTTFTLASRLRNPVFPATVTTGGGLTGVSAFLIWMVSIQAIFGYNEQGVLYSLCVLFGIGGALPIIAFLLYLTFIRAQFIQNYLAAEPDKGSSSSNYANCRVGSAPNNFIAQPEGQGILAALETAESLSPDTVGGLKNAKLDERKNDHATAIIVKDIREKDDLPSKWPKNVYFDSLSKSSKDGLHDHFDSTTGNRRETLRAHALACWRVLGRCYPSVVFCFFACFITYLLFPVVGPLHWSTSSTQKDIITGVFQFGDFVGRYLPILGGYVPFFRPKLKGTFIFLMLRLIFIPTFIVTQRVPSLIILGDFWFQILETLLLAMGMGFTTTLMMVRAPTFLDDDDKLGRSKASSLGVFGILLGMALGQWASNLLVL